MKKSNEATFTHLETPPEVTQRSTSNEEKKRPPKGLLFFAIFLILLTIFLKIAFSCVFPVVDRKLEMEKAQNPPQVHLEL